MLDVYRDVAENVAAVPVYLGEKSASERFAGANAHVFDRSADARRQSAAGRRPHTNSGRISRARTTSRLQAEDQTQQFAWTTSWGMSWRMLGALIMVHGDDRGSADSAENGSGRGRDRADRSRRRYGGARRGARAVRRLQEGRLAREARRPSRTVAGLQVQRVGHARRTAAHRTRRARSRGGRGDARPPRPRVQRRRSEAHGAARCDRRRDPRGCSTRSKLRYSRKPKRTSNRIRSRRAIGRSSSVCSTNAPG